MRAFQPQNPRSIDANTTPDKDTKRPPPPLVDTEGSIGLDATMGTGLAVTSVFSCFHFSRVVLDFLLCCHNLEVHVLLGGAPRSFNGQVRPPFSSPQTTKKPRSSARKKTGAGSYFEKNEGGVQAGQPGRRGPVSEKNETNKQSPSQIICDLATTVDQAIRQCFP